MARPRTHGPRALEPLEQRKLSPTTPRTNAPFNLRKTTLEAAARRGRGRVRLLGRARAARAPLVGRRELLARAADALRRGLHTLGRPRKNLRRRGTPARGSGDGGGHGR